MTTYDYRALCVELLTALENAISIIYCEDGTKHISTAKPIVNRARAALADGPAVPQGRESAAVTGQPSDEELWELYQGPGTFSPIEYALDLLARRGNPAPQPAAVTGQLSDEELLNLAQQYSVVYLLSDGSACHPFQEGYDMRNDVLNFARAVLARWGNQPAPPADGEVAEVGE